jgi:cyclopropane-fatty-acyl-phospholipid synthase
LTRPDRDSGEPLTHGLIDRALGLGVVPDGLVRKAARRAARSRISRELEGGIEAQQERLNDLIIRMSTGPIAERADSANTQHYEVPSSFFRTFLGPHLKYSACYWPTTTTTLSEAEEYTLDLCCRRAGIVDGMDLLDLGCGCGSMSLWMAEHFPGSRIVAVSNSSTQKASIERDAGRRGLTNIEVVTADVNDFEPDRKFDRVVSIEMFEHLRNWDLLLGRIASWLEPGGRLFVHVFSHRRFAYRFTDSWFADRFFTAGTMPSQELMIWFQRAMRVERRWDFDGTHYARTLEAWLDGLDSNPNDALGTLPGSSRERRTALAQWRVFLMAAAETWAFNQGQDWTVSHYLLAPRND